MANEMPGGFDRFLYFGPLRRLSFYNPKFFAVYSDEAKTLKSNLDVEESDEDEEDEDEPEPEPEPQEEAHHQDDGANAEANATLEAAAVDS